MYVYISPTGLSCRLEGPTSAKRLATSPNYVFISKLLIGYTLTVEVTLEVMDLTSFTL